MGHEKNIRHLKGESLASFLQTSPFGRGNHTIQVTHQTNGSGELSLRDNTVIAAKCGRLYGNAAIMIMAGWEDVHLSESPTVEDVRKNVTLKSENLPDLLTKNGVVEQFSTKQEAVFRENT